MAHSAPGGGRLAGIPQVAPGTGRRRATMQKIVAILAGASVMAGVGLAVLRPAEAG